MATPQDEIDIIKNSGLFNKRYYMTHGAPIEPDMDPITHYVQYGAQEFRNPCRTFDTLYYVSSNPDVAASGLNPLVHYILFGQEEGRAPLYVAPPSVPNAKALPGKTCGCNKKRN